MSRFSAVIFDLDGTLADSQLDFSAMRRETSCPEDIGLLEFIDSLEDERRRAQAVDVVHRHEMAGARRATWMPGAQALCRRLAHSPLPVGILTRNSRQAAELTIRALDIPHDMLVAREDAPPKPDPAGLLAILEAFGVAAQDAVYVGDYRYDLEAAANAGMASCLYDAGHGQAFRAQADIVVDHFDALAALLFADGR
ncbi:MAG: HAD family hydrolase [Halieaceae bacterium]|jgi:HAD superfamily hydrolase (TIGR01509 family)|nr:HAD family hydrolase [Halieaceae bacterium]